MKTLGDLNVGDRFRWADENLVSLVIEKHENRSLVQTFIPNWYLHPTQTVKHSEPVVFLPYVTGACFHA